MKKKQTWILFVIIILALSARILPGTRTIDDSFITYRYAHNILAGNGFLYNPGESVLGTTTPLYTLIMSAFGFVFGGENANFPVIAWIFNAILDAITCVLFIQLGKKLNQPLVSYASALFWAIAPYSVTFAIGGLETSLYVLLLVGMVYSYLNERFPLTALLAGLSILTRPDAVLLVAPIVLDRFYLAFRKQKKIKLIEWLALLLIPAIWFSFAWLMFGSPIPHSVTAKMAVYRLGPAASFIRLIQHYATPFMDQHLFGNNATKVGIVIFPFLSILGSLTALRQNKRLWPWVVFPWLYLIAFSVPNPLIFRWYLTTPLPAYILFILIGLQSLFTTIIKAIKQPLPKRIVQILMLLALFAYPLTAGLSAWTVHPDHGADRPAPDMAFIKLELLYQQAAELIQPYLQPADVLAAGDVGVLGYQTNAIILDTVGLNSTQSMQYYPIDADQYVINYAIPTQLILNEQPDAIIILEVYGRNTFLQNQTFRQQYTLLESIPTDIYGSEGMLLFQRNPD
ncbi:MAG: hypothetical protein JEZ00_18360 [Anaerolineaceae bacterium]|nr:hypothetical protein [Anaerolineaceae bacterium]